VRNITLLSGTAALAVLVLVIFCGIQLPNLSTRYSIRQFFPVNHPVLKTEDEITKNFDIKESSKLFIVLDLPEQDKGDWLEPARMADLQSLTSILTNLSEAKYVVSLANVELAHSSQKELRIGTLNETTLQKDWSTVVDEQPLLRGQLLSADHRSALIAITPKGQSSEEWGVLDAKIGKVLKESASHYHTGVAGLPVVQSRLAKKLFVEVSRFFLLCLVVFIFAFAFFYRNAPPVIFVACGLVISNICVLGLLSSLHVAFTVLLSTLPIILSIAFVSIAIHTLHLWADVLNANNHPRDLSTRLKLSMQTLRRILLPNLLGSLTTAIGFLALATTAIPAIRDYAIVVGAGVMATFVLAHIYMTFTLLWITPVQRNWMRGPAEWTKLVTRFALPLFIGILVLCLVGTGSAINLNFSSRLFDDLPDNEAVRVDTRHIDQNFGGTVALDLAIDSLADGTWTQPESLTRLAKVLTQVRATSGVGSAIGITDFLQADALSSSSKISEALFLYSMSPENPLRQFVDNNSRRTRFSLRLQDLPSDQVDGIRSSIRNVVQSAFPHAVLSEGGLAVTSHTINREVAKDLVFGFWQSFAAIGLVLIIIFRSLRWALVACLPNLVAPTVLLGAMALFDTPIKPAIAIIFSIALGLAFNNTVYLISRLRRLLGEKSGFSLPLRRTLLEEGNPCLSESVLTLAGFLIFLSSDFKLNQTFGAYMVLSILAGALGDLVFLPAILKLFPKTVFNETRRKLSPLRFAKQPASNGVIAAGVVAALFILFTSTPAARATAQDEGTTLLQQSRKNLEAHTDQAKIVLTIVEANGDKKERTLNLKTMRDVGTFRALARIEAPTDVKGTGLLAEIKDGTENQWLYLPSSHQVRRVVSGKKTAGVLGSELSPEDLNASAIKGASEHLMKKDATHAWIEIKPADGTSEYSRVVVTLALPQALPMKTEYYVGDTIKKSVEFKNYIALGKLYRAKRIEVHNLENGRGTNVDLSQMKINARMSESDFTESALQRPE
jgi:predicted RND superfamily exporter protein